MFVKSSEHVNGGRLISELIAREGFSRLNDDGTLLKAKAFDGQGNMRFCTDTLVILFTLV